MLRRLVQDERRNGVREDVCSPRRSRTSFSVSTASNEESSDMKLKHTLVGAATMSTDWAICACMVDVGVGISLRILSTTQLACVSPNLHCNTASTGCLAAG